MTPAALLLPALLLVASAGPALAGYDRVELAKAPGWDPESESGWCEIRLDSDANAALRLDNAEATLSTDAGEICEIHEAVCNAPMRAGAGNFRVSRLEGFGRLELLWPPTARNGWKAMIRIYDATPDFESYAVRLEWTRTRLPEGLPTGTKDLDNDEILSLETVSFEGPGKGSVEGAGAADIELAGATCRVDAKGALTGSFTARTGETFVFEGHLTSATRFQMVATFQMSGTPGRRGSMTIERNRNGELKRIFVQGIDDGRRFTIRFSS